jgi:hypothetical protein
MRSNMSLRRAVMAGLVSAIVVLAPSAAWAASPPTIATATATATDACAVTSAQLSWGFKESFRSYISGSIAHGTWEVQGGATYETPRFGWTGGAGTYSPETSTGSIAFPGGIRFTGHDGLLDTTVQNPTVVFTGPATAQLLIDITGVSMENALAGVNTPVTTLQVPLLDLDFAAAVVETQHSALTVSVVDAPATITAEGFAAFGNYETGTPFDALSLIVSAECPQAAMPAPTPTETAEAPIETDAAAAASAPTPWLPWVIAGGAVVVVGAAAAFAVARRRERKDDSA